MPPCGLGAVRKGRHAGTIALSGMIGDTPKTSAGVEEPRTTLTHWTTVKQEAFWRLATCEAKKSHWQGCQSEARGYIRRRAGAPYRGSALSAGVAAKAARGSPEQKRAEGRR